MVTYLLITKSSGFSLVLFISLDFSKIFEIFYHLLFCVFTGVIKDLKSQPISSAWFIKIKNQKELAGWYQNITLIIDKG